MPDIKPQLYLILITLVFFLGGCNTTKTIYRNSTSKKNYLIVKSVNLTHCGCTEIYADHYKSGKLVFQIFYNDEVARKTIFEYTSNNKTPKVHSLIATTSENFTTSFDPLDLEIFNAISSSPKPQGFSYPLLLTKLKGYINDTLSSHN